MPLVLPVVELFEVEELLDDVRLFVVELVLPVVDELFDVDPLPPLLLIFIEPPDVEPLFDIEPPPFIEPLFDIEPPPFIELLFDIEPPPFIEPLFDIEPPPDVELFDVEPLPVNELFEFKLPESLEQLPPIKAAAKIIDNVTGLLIEKISPSSR